MTSRKIVTILAISLPTYAAFQQPAHAANDPAVPIAAKAPRQTYAYTHEGSESLYRAARYADAEKLCKQAITEIERTRGPKSPELAPPLIDLGTIYMRLARYADAKQVIDRAESVLDATKPDQALLLGRLGINKGWRLYTLGETPAALKVFEDSRALIEKNQTGDSVDLAEILNNIGLMVEETGQEEGDDAKLAESKRLLFRGLDMRRKLTGDESPETAESLNNLGMHLLFNGKNAADIQLGIGTLKKALEVTEKVYGPDNPETAMSHTNMAIACLMSQKFDLAEREVRKAMPVTRRFLGEMHPDRAYELTTLGRILEEQTDYDEAELALAKAVEINEQVYGKNHANTVASLETLRGLYEAKGDQAKVQEIQKRIEKASGKEI